MTTMRVILTRAARMTRAVQIGSTPAPEEMTAAMEDAQSYYLYFPIRTLTPKLVSANYTAKENERATPAAEPDAPTAAEIAIRRM
jgi:hypothetical protein